MHGKIVDCKLLIFPSFTGPSSCPIIIEYENLEMYIFRIERRSHEMLGHRRLPEWGAGRPLASWALSLPWAFGRETKKLIHPFHPPASVSIAHGTPQLRFSPSLCRFRRAILQMYRKLSS